MSDLKIRLEWKVPDLWIGAFWKVTPWEERHIAEGERYDLWICLLPCLPIHITWQVVRPIRDLLDLT